MHAIGRDIVLGKLADDRHEPSHVIRYPDRGAGARRAPAEDHRRQRIARGRDRGEECRHQTIGIRPFMVPHRLGERTKQPGIEARLVTELADRPIARLVAEREAGEAAVLREAVDVNPLQTAPTSGPWVRRPTMKL